MKINNRRALIKNPQTRWTLERGYRTLATTDPITAQYLYTMEFSTTTLFLKME